MNLELIRKYEKEFLHMLHGGKLKYFTGKEWLSYSSAEIWTGNNDLKIIINDKYVELRKALAEGKTIQFFNTKERLYDSSKTLHTWHDITSIFTHGMSSDYRIKPEEPELKVGDYVRYIHANSPKPLRISNINCERYYFENAKIILRIDEIEKWEPKEGEVCIFWDDSSDDAFIAKFESITNDGQYNTERSFWNNCMPFTGVLPTHMKDNK